MARSLNDLVPTLPPDETYGIPEALTELGAGTGAGRLRREGGSQGEGGDQGEDDFHGSSGLEE